MKIYSDLHIHSRYALACSKDLRIDNLEKWARIKGLNLLGTGDCLHPKWLEEIKQKLNDQGNGIYQTENGFNFVLSTEVANFFRRGDKARKIHNILLFPNLEVVEEVIDYLSPRGKLGSDGRPMFAKFDCVELAEGLKSISEQIEIIPAHIWTPWFGILGSKSGFDTVEECFEDQSKHIHALETGLSSDPEMNWRYSKLDKYTLVSNSDLHSYWPWKIGRECNVFDIDLNYQNLIDSIRTRKGFVETLEVDPAYGKYHWDGHRKCGISMSPQESQRVNGICPKCGNKLQID